MKFIIYFYYYSNLIRNAALKMQNFSKLARMLSCKQDPQQLSTQLINTVHDSISIFSSTFEKTRN